LPGGKGVRDSGTALDASPVVRDVVRLDTVQRIRRGVPGMSPTLMSKRLREMEARGLVLRSQSRSTGEISYATTEVANELETIVHALGEWAHRNVDAEVTLENPDARLLMWNMRRKINVSALPRSRRTVVEFTYPELPKDERSYWLISNPGLPSIYA
jgi:DNA-binding HxlR family transcriptional regulator